MSDWIAFKDQKPLNNQKVNVKSDDLWHGQGIFQDGKIVINWLKGACFGDETHWMPLPEAPNE